MDGALELSILDHVQLADDERFSTSVANSVRLAKVAKDCGYARYWIAEHHGPNLFCASPEVMIASIAAATRRIRVGSAGVLLSYYSPFKVAETFQTQAALFPGRIDLGVARGSGVGVPEVFSALMDGRPRIEDPKALTEVYEAKVKELLSHMRSARLVSEATQRGEPDTSPRFWLLGSGTESARMAARFGTGVSLFMGWTKTDLPAVITDYSRDFCPMNDGHEAAASIAIAGLCTDSNEEAEAVRRTSGFPGDHPGIWGTPEHCRRIILEAAQRHGVRRIVILPICSTFAQQERMYRMVSEALLRPSAGLHLASSAKAA
jgi:luciferase family oxidoreductase group 1